MALEQELAEWLEMEACLLFSSAYAANVGALSALALDGDVVFSDKLNHASIIDGCRLSRARTVVVPHRDLSALAAALAQPVGPRGVRWVVTESYFGMDGTTPDFAALRDLCDRHGAALIVDEAHSLGVFGLQGRGLAAAAGVQPDVLVGGLGKAFGLQGGFVASSRLVHEWLWNRARSFVFSTGVSPWLCARAREHLRHVKEADRERAHLALLGARFARELTNAGVPLPDGRHGPLFPIIFGTEEATLAAAAALERAGIRVQPIRPPTVPRGSARLRISLRADMSHDDVERLASALRDAWREHLATDSEAAGSNREAVAASTDSPAVTSGASPTGGSPASSAPILTGSGLGTPSIPPAPRASMPPASPISLLPVSALPATAPWALPATASSSQPPASPSLSSSSSTPSPSPSAPSPPSHSSSTSPPSPAAHQSSAAPASFYPSTRPRVSLSTLADHPQPRWVVLGTGTGVGKSYAAAALARVVAGTGRPVAGLKPVETGCRTGEDGAPREGDAALLEAASFQVRHPRPHPLYGFREPIAPSVAAHREGQKIDLDAIASWVDRARCQSAGAPALVVETAGGVFSPLSKDATNFELASALGPACWVLVAPDRLGVLHELTSTLRAMFALRRSPDVLVLSAPTEPDASTGSNASELRRLGVPQPVIELGRGQELPLRPMLDGLPRVRAE